jgi:hypothetical protein
MKHFLLFPKHGDVEAVCTSVVRSLHTMAHRNRCLTRTIRHSTRRAFAKLMTVLLLARNILTSRHSDSTDRQSFSMCRGIAGPKHRSCQVSLMAVSCALLQIVVATSDCEVSCCDQGSRCSSSCLNNGHPASRSAPRTIAAPLHVALASSCVIKPNKGERTPWNTL